MTATNQQPGWILSPVWDTVFFLAPPLVALVPILTIDFSRFPATHLLMLLAVVAAGHHVPGFIRAYSDPELMARYRGRMLLAPPLLIAATLWLEFERITGLQVVLILWGVWHFLMQDYGLLRIYGVKRGEISAASAMWDWLLMLTWIVAIYLNNPNWSYRLQLEIYELGCPFLPPAFFPAIGSLVFVLALLVSIGYVIQAMARARRGEAPSPLKYVLLLTTLVFFLLAFQWTRSVLWVTVIVELVHDLQYYALAWAFQRRLSERHGSRHPWLRTLFQPRPAMMLLYVSICLVYGAGLSEYGRTYLYPDSLLVRVATAVLYAATIFHFYSDGFIWKVRQPRTREYLGIERPSKAAPARYNDPPAWRRSLVHFACYAGILGMFFAFHQRTRANSLEVSATLARQFPQLGDAHHNLGFEYQRLGQPEPALREYTIALQQGVDRPVELRQRMAWAWESLGRYEEALGVLREALQLASSELTPQVAAQLALLLAECPQTELRNGPEAVRLAELACPTSGPNRALYLDILAASYQAAGAPREAAEAAKMALAEAQARQQQELVRQIEARLGRLGRQ